MSPLLQTLASALVRDLPHERQELASRIAADLDRLDTLDRLLHDGSTRNPPRLPRTRASGRSSRLLAAGG